MAILKLSTNVIVMVCLPPEVNGANHRCISSLSNKPNRITDKEVQSKRKTKLVCHLYISGEKIDNLITSCRLIYTWTVNQLSKMNGNLKAARPCRLDSSVSRAFVPPNSTLDLWRSKVQATQVKFTTNTQRAIILCFLAGTFQRSYYNEKRHQSPIEFAFGFFSSICRVLYLVR